MHPQVKFSETYAIIPNVISTNHYPLNIMSDKEWRRYLQLLYSWDVDKQFSIYGYKHFKTICSCTSTEFKKITSRLESLKLIKTKKFRPQGKLTAYTVMVPPLYDAIKRTAVTVVDAPLSRWTISNNKIHFTMIPRDALLIGLCCKHLSINTLRLLIKLYHHTNYELFGCVDPNVIRESNGRIYCNPSLLFDLGIGQEELDLMLRDLITLRLLFWEERKLYEERFDNEERLRLADDNTSNSVICRALVPTYQLDWRNDRNETSKHNRTQ